MAISLFHPGDRHTLRQTEDLNLRIGTATSVTCGCPFLLLKEYSKPTEMYLNGLKIKEINMAIKVTKEANKKKPIYFQRCDICGCEFEFEKSDIHSEFFDQREGYNIIFIPCPSCSSITGVKEKIIRYE